MCKLVELLKFIKEHYGYTKLYLTTPYTTLFTLSEDEQINIINLINASGQRIITVENRILEPKIARFAVNVYAKVWEGVDE